MKKDIHNKDFELSPAKVRVLEMIHKINEENKWTPSLREVARKLGYSSASSVFKYGVELAQCGLISRSPAGVRLTDIGIRFLSFKTGTDRIEKVIVGDICVLMDKMEKLTSNGYWRETREFINQNIESLL